MHDNEEVCLENLYDNALDDGPMLLDDINYNSTKNGTGEVFNLARRSPIPFESDQSSCYTIIKSELEEVMILNTDPTILELDMNYVLIDHDKHALCNSYVVEFVHILLKIGLLLVVPYLLRVTNHFVLLFLKVGKKRS